MDLHTAQPAMEELKQKINELIQEAFLDRCGQFAAQKWQEGFRAGTGCSAECMAIVEHAERFVRCRDNYESLRSAVLGLNAARADAGEQRN